MRTLHIAAGITIAEYIDCLLAHFWVDHAGMNGIDPDPRAFSRKIQGQLFGENADPTLGHGIKRIQRRANQPGDR